MTATKQSRSTFRFHNKSLSTEEDKLVRTARRQYDQPNRGSACPKTADDKQTILENAMGSGPRRLRTSVHRDASTGGPTEPKDSRGTDPPPCTPRPLAADASATWHGRSTMRPRNEWSSSMRPVRRKPGVLRLRPDATIRGVPARGRTFAVTRLMVPHEGRQGDGIGTNRDDSAWRRTRVEPRTRTAGANWPLAVPAANDI